MTATKPEIPKDLQAKWRIGADGEPVRRRGQPRTLVDDLRAWLSEKHQVVDFILDHPGPLKAAKADAVRQFRMSLRTVNTIWSVAGGKKQALAVRDAIHHNLAAPSSDQGGNSTLEEGLQRAADARKLREKP